MSQQAIPFMFPPSTVQLIVEGLSELPYKRVASTIEQIVTHANAALQPPAPPAPPARRRKPASE